MCSLESEVSYAATEMTANVDYPARQIRPKFPSRTWLATSWLRRTAIAEEVAVTLYPFDLPTCSWIASKTFSVAVCVDFMASCCLETDPTQCIIGQKYLATILDGCVSLMSLTHTEMLCLRRQMGGRFEVKRGYVTVSWELTRCQTRCMA